MRRILFLLILLCLGCTGARTTEDVRDLPGVFKVTVQIPEALMKLEPTWKETPLKEETLPRYSCLPPTAGDYALYHVNRTYDHWYADHQTASYLMLEVIMKAGPDHTVSSTTRVYGLSRNRGGKLVHKGLTNSAEEYVRHDPPGSYWPGPFWSFDGATLSVSDLRYFRNYSAFIADTEVQVRSHAFDRLNETFESGTLTLFGMSYIGPLHVSAGYEHLIVSNTIPVRGLIYGYDYWASSSGLRNHVERITLLNHGRLTASELEFITSGPDLLPSEAALWARLTKAGEPVKK